MIEEDILEQIDAEDDPYRIIMGDTNCRLGGGFMPDDEDEEDWRDETNTLERLTSDLIVNSFGRRLIELCLSLGLTPLHGSWRSPSLTFYF